MRADEFGEQATIEIEAAARLVANDDGEGLAGEEGFGVGGLGAGGEGSEGEGCHEEARCMRDPPRHR